MYHRAKKSAVALGMSEQRDNMRVRERLLLRSFHFGMGFRGLSFGPSPVTLTTTLSQLHSNGAFPMT